MADVLLARYADCIFWMARYVERAENLVRILDTTQSFARDRTGAPDWMPVVRINSDDTRFFEKHDQADSGSVLRFYVTDAQNPTSIAFAFRAARENARTLRPFISSETWVQLNRLHGRMAHVGDSELAPGNRGRLFDELKEACQTHAGIAEGTFYRDQGWYFYQLGRALERADQCTRLVDIKYHSLLPRAEDVGTPVDASQWNALLRTAAAYHAYLRQNAGGISPARVAGFLLLSSRFPRSVNYCVREMDSLLMELQSRYGLRGAQGANERLDRMRAMLSELSIQQIIAGGLHEFLDMLQQQIIGITASLTAAYFE